MSEINVVPLVDVVLVLLIIFMITANVMEFGLDIQVPKVRRVQNTAQDLPGCEYHEERRILPE